MKRKILLVDDDASLLATLGDFLASEGYDVLKADSGEQALALLKRARPSLIVLDMSMPGIGGMGVLERITRRDGSTRYPVLVLTARAMMAEYFANKQVDGFIAKPCDPEDLALEISRILFQRGEAADAAPAAPLAEAVRRVLLGESDKARHQAVRDALVAAGFEVESVFRGPEVLEAAVLAPPDAVVLRLEMDGASADGLVSLLAQMNKTRGLPIVVYGVGDSRAQLEHVAALDEKSCRLLPGLAPEAVAAAVTQALGRR
jgi:CheY-like chemotaxis protein